MTPYTSTREEDPGDEGAPEERGVHAHVHVPRGDEEELHGREHPQHRDQEVVVEIAFEVVAADLDRSQDAQHDRDEDVLARTGMAVLLLERPLEHHGVGRRDHRVVDGDDVGFVRLGDVGARISHASILAGQC